MEAKIMLGPNEVQDLFSIPKGTLSNWRSRKMGPRFYKLSRKILYRLEDLQEFFMKNPIEPEGGENEDNQLPG